MNGKSRWTCDGERSDGIMTAGDEIAASGVKKNSRARELRLWLGCHIACEGEKNV